MNAGTAQHEQLFMRTTLDPIDSSFVHMLGIERSVDRISGVSLTRF